MEPPADKNEVGPALPHQCPVVIGCFHLLLLFPPFSLTARAEPKISNLFHSDLFFAFQFGLAVFSGFRPGCLEITHYTIGGCPAYWAGTV
ncbi:hypothetical protein ASPWEDRAFT_34135, partial [Aspergillus wentii DTO 134E9]